jgi:large repetitive protein
LEENFDRINIAINKEKEMVAFRRWFPALAVPLVFAGLASAQVSGSGSTPLTCSTNVTSTPILRSEGITEEVGDIVITCTGGTIYSTLGNSGTSNPLAPATNITVSLTSSVTSRLLSVSGVSEALLLIDEPNSGLTGPISGFGPTEPFTGCNYPASGGCAGVSAGSLPTSGIYVQTQAANVAGQTGSYQTAVTGTPSPTNVTISTTPSTTPAPNAYQGVVSGNQVTFFGVPVVPPGSNGQRIFRITNVRINASGIGGGTASGSLPVQASIAVSNFTALPITNPTPLVGFVQSSLATSVTGPVPYGQCNSQTAAPSAILTFSEKFASAFKTRVDPSAAGQTAPVNSQTKGQGDILVQNIPGTVYFSESGFTLADGTLPSGPLTGSTVSGITGTTGLADFGTRFTAVFNSVPVGAHVLLSVYSVSTAAGAVVGQINSGPAWAAMVTGPTVVDGSGGAPLVSATGTAAAGVQYVEITPPSTGAVAGATYQATWETMASQQSVLDTFQFGVYISYTASPGTNSPAAGTGTVNLSYAPYDTDTTASATDNVPRFLNTSTAANAISIGLCQTTLLFPFITNELGFDTGIAIANTSTDPFGTTPQNGTCVLNWYGTAAPSTPTTTPSVATATEYTTLASVTVPGFQGYMIAVCNFEYAHGFAFISNVGATADTMGYLPLVIPQPSLNGGRKANDQADSVVSSGEQLSQ